MWGRFSLAENRLGNPVYGFVLGDIWYIQPAPDLCNDFFQVNLCIERQHKFLYSCSCFVRTYIPLMPAMLSLKIQVDSE